MSAVNKNSVIKLVGAGLVTSAVTSVFTAPTVVAAATPQDLRCVTIPAPGTVLPTAAEIAAAEQAYAAAQTENANAQAKLADSNSALKDAAAGTQHATAAASAAQNQLLTAQQAAALALAAAKHTAQAELAKAQAALAQALADLAAKEQAVIAAQNDSAAAADAAQTATAQATAAQASATAIATPADLDAAGKLPKTVQLQQRIATLAVEIAQLEAQLANAKAQEQSGIDTAAQLQGAINNLQTELDTAQAAHAAAAAAKNQAEHDQTAAIARVQQAQQELADALANNGVDSAEYQNKTAQLAAAQAVLDAASTKITQLDQQLADLNQQQIQLASQLQTHKDQLLQLEQNSVAADQAAAELAQKQQQLQAELTSKQAELAQKQQELDQIAAEIAALAQTPTTGFTHAQLLAAAVTETETALYHSSAGNPQRVTTLAAAPGNLNDYYLQVQLQDRQKLQLAVTSVQESSANGTSVYLVTGKLPAVFGADKSVRVQTPQANTSAAGVYTSFAALVAALRNDPHALVQLGADLHADELADSTDTSYITTDFSGVLEGQGYQIKGLTKPLFAKLAGAQVNNLILSDVRISGQQGQVAALAQTATGSARVSKLRVHGEIAGTGQVAGAVAYTNQSFLEDVVVTGTVTNYYNGDRSHTGGVVALASGGTLRNLAFQGTLTTVFGGGNNNRVGGVIGQLNDNARAINLYAGGQLQNLGARGQVGGLVGSTWSDNGRHGRVQQAVTALRVTGGKVIHGDAGFRGPISGVAVLAGEAAGAADPHPYGTEISAADLEFYFEQMPFLRDLRKNTAPSDYSQVTGAVASRAQAYRNYAKLLPYADADTVVRAANLLADTDPLVTKELLAVLPTSNGKPVTNPVAQKAQIDGIVLRYSDDTVEKRAVIADTRENPGAQLWHYYMAGELPYMPHLRGVADSAAITSLAAQLTAVAFDDIDVKQFYTASQWQTMVTNAHNNAVNEARRKNQPEPDRAASELRLIADQRGLLYLRETFQKQRQQLEMQLAQLFARETTALNTAAAQAEFTKKILANKQALLLGLAYLNKWYDINFGQVNLRDLLLFNQEFYQGDRSAVDLLIQLGSDYKLLDPRNNLDTYRILLAPVTKQADVALLLDQLRKQFTDAASFDDWFRATSKAYIVEAPSMAKPDANVSAADRFTKHQKYRAGLLPILTVGADSVFVIVHMTSVALGTFERYYDVRNTSAAQKPQKIAEIKRNIDSYAQKYRDYYDLWYRIGNDAMRQKLINDVPVWDGYSYRLGWTNRYGPGNFQSVEEFFGPIGRWFAANGLAGYSNRSATFMVVDGMLGSYVTYTHEMVHNLDHHVFMGGYRTRRNGEPELYPTSLLQTVSGIGQQAWGFNQANYFTDNGGTYLHNTNPSRFQNIQDADNYFKGYFEALYLLEMAEAEALLQFDDAQKAKIFMRLGHHESGGKRHLNSYDALTVGDISAMQLQNINDLIDNSLMIRRQLGPSNGPLRANGYYSVPILDPLYGTGESDLGISGESVFKRNAFELWAARGYHDGFVPYTSDKYGQEAAAQGQPHLPDTFIMPKIFGQGSFTSLKDYRKHAYQRAKERAAQHLKYIGMQFDGEIFPVADYTDLVQRFHEYFTEDFARGGDIVNSTAKSKAFQFKQKLFSMMMRSTQEFRTSIYSDVTVPAGPAAAASTPIVAPVYTSVAQPVNDISTPAYAGATLPAVADPAQLAQLETAKTQLTQQIAALTGQAQAVNSALTAARSEHATAVAAATALQTQLLAAQQQLALLETRKTQIADQLQTAAAEKLAQQAQADTAANLRADLLAKLAGLQQEIVAYTRQLEQARKLLADAKSVYDTALAKVQEKAGDLNAAQAALQEKTDALAVAQQQLQDLQDRVQNLLQQQAAKETEKQRLNQLLTAIVAFETALVKQEQAAQAAALAAANAQQVAQEQHTAQILAQQAATAQQQAAAQSQLVLNKTVAELAANSAQLETAYPQLAAALAQLTAAAQTFNDAQAKQLTAQNKLAGAQTARAAVQREFTAAENALTQARAERDRLRKLQQEAKNEVSCVAADNLTVTLPVFTIPAAWLNSADPALQTPAVANTSTAGSTAASTAGTAATVTRAALPATGNDSAAYLLGAAAALGVAAAATSAAGRRKNKAK